MASNRTTIDRQAGMTWKQMQRATDARERAEYKATTPGARIEAVLRLAKELPTGKGEPASRATSD